MGELAGEEWRLLALSCYAVGATSFLSEDDTGGGISAAALVLRYCQFAAADVGCAVAFAADIQTTATVSASAIISSAVASLLVAHPTEVDRGETDFFPKAFSGCFIWTHRFLR